MNQHSGTDPIVYDLPAQVTSLLNHTGCIRLGRARRRQHPASIKVHEGEHIEPLKKTRFRR